MNTAFNVQHIDFSDSMRTECSSVTEKLGHLFPQISDLIVSVNYHKSTKSFEVEFQANLNRKWHFVDSQGRDFKQALTKAQHALSHELERSKTKQKRARHNSSLNTFVE